MTKNWKGNNGSLLKFNNLIVVMVLGFVVVPVVGYPDDSQSKRLTSDVVENPFDAKFVYRDIQNFISAIETIAAGEESATMLQLKYLDSASPGLRMFIEKYDLTVARLQGAMEDHPEAYARLPRILEELKAQEPTYQKAYAAIQEVIPNAVFPPTYFLVGGFRGIGSGSTEGPLISIEKKTVESIQSDLVATLVHEMVHMEQLATVGEAYFAIFSGKERTLLATSIREGAATFMAELIAGGSKHKNLAGAYYRAHEKILWPEFEEAMLGHDMGDWLWRKPARQDQPQDLGYAIGARIVESFYSKAPDKQKAAQEIMAITDYPAFLARSGYVERWRERIGSD